MATQFKPAFPNGLCLSVFCILLFSFCFAFFYLLSIECAHAFTPHLNNQHTYKRMTSHNCPNGKQVNVLDFDWAFDAISKSNYLRR